MEQHWGLVDYVQKMTVAALSVVSDILLLDAVVRPPPHHWYMHPSYGEA